MKAPRKLNYLFKINNPEWSHKRYFPIYGGRGSAKTETVGRALIILSLQEKTRILCAREFQNSIEDSVHQVLQDIIQQEGLGAHFHITKTRIISDSGTEFIFKGLKRETTDSLKSIKGVKYVWVEEAHSVSHRSWDILDPTIREENSKIIMTFNREFEDDPIWERWCEIKRDDTELLKMNYTDNPFFPESLQKIKDYDQEHRPHLYPHIWLGEPIRHSEARIFKFDPEVNLYESDIAYTAGTETCISFDFGVQDDTAIGFYNVINVPKTEKNKKGLIINVFDEYVNNNEHAEHYREVVDSRGYQINNVYGDPSGVNRDSSLLSWVDRISKNPKTGVRDWHFIYHNQYSPTEMIDIANEFMPYVRINRFKCPRFYKMFTHWSYRVDKQGKVVMPAKPMHDSFSHPGTSFYYFMAFRFGRQINTKVQVL